MSYEQHTQYRSSVHAPGAMQFSGEPEADRQTPPEPRALCRSKLKAHCSALVLGLAALSALSTVVGCGDEVATPEPGADAGVDTQRGDSGIDSARGDTGLESLAVETSALSLRINVAPFSFELRSASGIPLLRSLPTSLELDGNVIAGAYGPPSATFNAPVYQSGVRDGWDSYVGEDDPWLTFDQTLEASVSAGVVLVRLGTSSRSDLEIEVRLEATENRLQVEITLEGEGAADFNRVGQSFFLDPDEQFYGLGGRATSVNHRGLSLENWVESSGLGLGEGVPPGPANPGPNGRDMTATPIPFMLSSSGYGLWLENTSRSGVHLGSEDSRYWRLQAAGRSVKYTVWVNQNPLRTLEDFTTTLGPAPLPPLWAFGPCRRLSEDTLVDDGTPEWRALREAGIPTSCIDDGRHLLPDGLAEDEWELVENWLDVLHEWGYAVRTSVGPYVALDEPSTEAWVQVGQREGYFVGSASGQALETFVHTDGPHAVVTIDITNVGAVAWFVELLEAFWVLDYDGWTVGFGETIPDTARFADGSLGSQIHNVFPVLVQAIIRDALDELEADVTPFVAARSGTVGTQMLVDLLDAGETNGSFDEADGLPAVLRMGLNLGMSGAPYFGAAIGGIQAFNDAPTDKEVYLRWLELAAWSPFMYEDPVGLMRGDQSSRWTLWSDAETTEAYRDYAALHTRLAAFFRGLAREATQTGAPIMRHPFLLFPTDEYVRDLDDQYFLGDAVLVAPVVTRGARSRAVYFPEGRYVDWEATRIIEGPAIVVVEALLRSVPVFLRAGAIVPMFDSRVQTLHPSEREDVPSLSDYDDVLDVRVVTAGGESDFEMADGTLLAVDVNVAVGSDMGQNDAVAGVGPPFRVGEVELPVAFSRAQVETCAGCYLLREDNGITTLWLTTPAGENLTAEGEGIGLQAVNPAGKPRRIRWEVILLGAGGDEE